MAADASMAAWVAICAVVAWMMKAVIDLLAVPAEKTAASARAMAEQMTNAESQARRVPVAGDELSAPFGSMASGLSGIAEQSLATASTIHHVAWAAFAVLFLVPVVAVGWPWLSRRLAFARESTAAQRFIDSSADLDLFALRALANQPMHQLNAISADPVTAWRSGDRAVIRALAKLELDRMGMRLPRDLTDANPRVIEPGSAAAELEGSGE